MKGGAWYENTIFTVWGLSGLEAADQVSDAADQVSDEETQTYPDTFF